MRTPSTLLPPSGGATNRMGFLVGFDYATRLWLPICSHLWNNELSGQACSQMGFGEVESLSSSTLPYFIPQDQVIRIQPIKIISMQSGTVQEAFSHR